MECLVGTRVQTTQSINEGLLDSVPKLRLCLVIFHMCKITFFLLLKITEINIENDAIFTISLLIRYILEYSASFCIILLQKKKKRKRDSPYT